MTGPLADLRASQDRDYASVGVAMLLELRSEVAPIPRARPVDRDVELAGLVTGFAQALVPGDGDRGSIIAVLQAAAFRDFDHSVITSDVHHGAAPE